jgi:hypothetical protein
VLLRELDAQPVDDVPQSPPDPDPDPPFLTTGHLTGHLRELGAGRIEGSGFLEQPLAVFGQRYALAMTKKERETELFLELMYVTAERGLGNVEAVPRPWSR